MHVPKDFFEWLRRLPIDKQQKERRIAKENIQRIKDHLAKGDKP